jgi:hypothetical protein
MRSLFDVARGDLRARALAWVVGSVAGLSTALAAAQITAPTLQPGSSFTVAHPDDVAASVAGSALVELSISADGSVSDSQIVGLSVSAPEAEARLWLAPPALPVTQRV